MAKKPGDSKKKSRAPKMAATEARTIEALSDEQRQALLFEYKRKLKALIATEKVAKDAKRETFKIAEAEGITKDEIMLAISLETPEGEAKAKMQADRIARVSRWMGLPIGAQPDMFGGPKPRPHFETGKRAAMDDQMRKPPDHLAQSDHNEWFEGYDAGREVRNVALASNFKPLGDGAAAADSLTH